LEDGYLPESSTRKRYVLDGPWSYHVAGQGDGTVTLPAAFIGKAEVVFERSLDIPAATIDNRQYHLVILGANHSCEVQFNGEFLLSHAGGYTSFSQPIPRNLISPGPGNVLRITVNNELGCRTTLPTRPQVWGWKNYGGLYREVFLLQTPTLYIRDVATSIELNDALTLAHITARGSFEGKLTSDSLTGGKVPTGEGLGFQFELVDVATGTPVGHSSVVPLRREGDGWGDVVADLSLQNPKLWNQLTPDLYTLRALIVRAVGKEQVVVDEYPVSIGIRKIEIKKADILLNGKRLILKGITWREEYPGYGNAVPYEEREKDVLMIRNAGANCIRFVHTPPHPAMIALCDRYGLLAMEELPLFRTPAELLGNEGYQELAATMLKEMVTRDRNHPSLFAWGIGDELQTSMPESQPFLSAITRLGRQLDARPIYYGTRFREADTGRGLVDFTLLTPYENDVKNLKKDLEQWRTLNRGKPLVVAGLGTEVLHTDRSGYSDPLSQQAQARFYYQRIDLIRSLDYDGMIAQAFNDWVGDRPSLTVHTGDPWIHTVGLVNANREKRLAYDAVQAEFLGEKMTALPMGNYTPGAPLVYVLAGFFVLLLAAYTYNASRRFRECVNRSMMNSYNFFADVRDQHLVSGYHTTLLGFIVSLTLAIIVSSLLFHYRESWVLDNLLSLLLVSDGLKEVVVRLIWNPFQFILVFAAVFFLLLLLVSGCVLLLRLAFKANIYPYHAYSVVLWSTPPLLALIPIGMILYRAIENPMYVTPAVIVVLALHLWVVLRLLKGISIIFDVSRMKVYLLGGFSVVCLLGILYAYYEVTAAAPMYLSYMYDVLAHGQ
jgi:hypothetical protein